MLRSDTGRDTNRTRPCALAPNRRIGKGLASVIGAAFVALSMAGCTSNTRAPVLLALPALPVAGASQDGQQDANASIRVAAVRRLELPEYMVSRRVRYRADTSTLAEWPNTYWAERIEIAASREFHAALRTQLSNWRLCEGTCATEASAVVIQTHLIRLDYDRQERTLRSVADITLWGTGSAPQRLRSTVREYRIEAESDTAQGQAQAMSELLHRMAVDTAGLLVDL